MKHFSKITQKLWSTHFVRDVFTLQLGGAFLSTLGFVQSVLYARMLGIHGWGIYATALAFRGTFVLLASYGQGQATSTFFAEKFAKKDTPGMQAVIRYYLILSFISVGALIIMALSAPALSKIFYGNAQIGTIASVAFLAVAAGSFHTLFLIFLQTLRKIKLLTALENGGLLLQTILGVGLLLLGYGSIGIFVGLLVSNICVQCILFIWYAKHQHTYKLPGLRNSIFSGESIRPFLMQGLWIAIHKNLANFLMPSTLFVMSFFVGHSTIGIAKLAYSIGLLPSSLMLTHANRMTKTVLPAIQIKGIATLRKNTAMLIKHTMAFHALLCFGSLFAMPPLVIIFYGWEYADVIVPALWIILISLSLGVSVANVTLFRIYRKSHIPAIWHMAILPIQLAVLIGALQITSPLNAFVLTILVYHMTYLWLCWYLYQNIFRKEAPLAT